jgi:hypothetical protein
MNWLKNMKMRASEIRILHICINDYFWTPADIWFVVTGRA